MGSPVRTGVAYQDETSQTPVGECRTMVGRNSIASLAAAGQEEAGVDCWRMVHSSQTGLKAVGQEAGVGDDWRAVRLNSWRVVGQVVVVVV